MMKTRVQTLLVIEKEVNPRDEVANLVRINQTPINNKCRQSCEGMNKVLEECPQGEMNIIKTIEWIEICLKK